MPSAHLHLRRVSQWQSYCRKFRVELDGKRLDGIKVGASREYDIEPGEHRLVVSIDWVSSDPMTFHCGAGEHIRFVCGHPDPSWKVGFRPSSLVSSIDLRPDDAAPT